MDERELGAYIRGVAGAWELVQLQWSRRFRREYGVSGGVGGTTLALLSGRSVTELSGLDLDVSAMDCCVTKLLPLSLYDANRAFSGFLTGMVSSATAE